MWELQDCPSRAPDSSPHSAWWCSGSRDPARRLRCPSGRPHPPGPQPLLTHRWPWGPCRLTRGGGGCPPRSRFPLGCLPPLERSRGDGWVLSCLDTGCGGRSNRKGNQERPPRPGPFPGHALSVALAVGGGSGSRTDGWRPAGLPCGHLRVPGAQTPPCSVCSALPLGYLVLESDFSGGNRGSRSWGQGVRPKRAAAVRKGVAARGVGDTRNSAGKRRPLGMRGARACEKCHTLKALPEGPRGRQVPG